jgi:hypothetical protein
MRTGTWIGLAGVVAIGVMWSIAAMSGSGEQRGI